MKINLYMLFYFFKLSFFNCMNRDLFFLYLFEDFGMLFFEDMDFFCLLKLFYFVYKNV